MSIDAVQQIALDCCAEWAAKHPCLKAIYIFGSTARGDHTATSDIDVAVEFNDLRGTEMVADFTALHAEADEFSAQLRGRAGRKVSLHRMTPAHADDDAWPKIVSAREQPVATKDKAMLVATPRDG